MTRPPSDAMRCKTSLREASSLLAVTPYAFVPRPITGIFSPLVGIAFRIGALSAARAPVACSASATPPATPAHRISRRDRSEEVVRFIVGLPGLRRRAPILRDRSEE